MFKILVVEDDLKIANIIKESLEKWSFGAKTIDSFDKIFEEFTEYGPHLVLMDINLPFYDGFYWCSKIREVSKVPVIFISSRNTNMDIIMAMNMGGDDFVTKPFSIDVLIAKINALLRRTYSYMDNTVNVIEVNGVILNLKDRTIKFKESSMELSSNEFKILELLMKNNGAVVSRDKIMRVLWDNEAFIDDNTLTVNVNRIRKKLKEMGIEEFIKTKKNQGYII